MYLVSVDFSGEHKKYVTESNRQLEYDTCASQQQSHGEGNTYIWLFTKGWAESLLVKLSSTLTNGNKKSLKIVYQKTWR